MFCIYHNGLSEKLPGIYRPAVARSRLKNEKTNIICWRKSRKTFETASSLVGAGDELYRSSISEPSRWYAKGKNWAIWVRLKNVFSDEKQSILVPDAAQKESTPIAIGVAT
jgi:hypothetical protein